jgi:thymidine phosphorylase
LPRARVVLPLPAARDGVVAGMDTREVGLVVVELGGGRRLASDRIDARVGLSDIRAVGTSVSRGEPLMQVHAASREAAHAAIARLGLAVRVAGRAPKMQPVVIDRV